ncbi:replication endonuclease [uncultured Aggregatibacter sp.]|mgnify:FL=1|uniref:replication endonuclease n=1 Tax=uncultured Aggregatibacter sp. TaxID=470564 RepID=UPI002637A85B|nr:replication endonuclease [uncultured Aggregatibacter sp.]
MTNWERERDIREAEKAAREPFFQVSPYVPYQATPEGLNIHQYELFNFNTDAFPFVNEYISKLPEYLSKYFVKRYIRTFRKNGYRAANSWVRETMQKGILDRVEGVMNRYPILTAINKPKGNVYTFGFIKNKKVLRKSVGLDEFTLHDVEDFSKSIAAELEEMVAEFEDKYIRNRATPITEEAEIDRIFNALYKKMAYFTKMKGVNPPFYSKFEKGNLDDESLNIAIEKMRSENWWQRQLMAIRSRIREHLAIAVGQVQAKASPYASREAIAEWKTQKRKNRQYIKQMVLINEDDQEEIIALDEMFYKTVSNPAVRRCELMVRMRGFEEVAKQLGHAGEFYTLTAPSCYHAVHSHGGFIKNWNFSSPADTQKYLCSVFAKIRASLKRQGIDPYGFRVVEPHHDGTPHWHLLLFMPQEHVDACRTTFKRYALEAFGDEIGAQEHRFTATAIDWEKGSATGYIAKYIAKNIDGYQCDDDTDDETGEKLKDMAANVSAWASKWRIRQFQQIGGSPVSVWRECRRKRGAAVEGDEKLTELVQLADKGDWAGYTLLQGNGNPCAQRKDLLARTAYEDRKPNDYGEISKKIIGFFNQVTTQTIFTRTKAWKIVKKAVVEGLLKISGLCPPWSSVNNCTERKNDRKEIPDVWQAEEQHHTLEKGEFLTAFDKKKRWLKKNRINLTASEKADLLLGRKVRLKSGEFLIFKYGEIIKIGGLHEQLH